MTETCPICNRVMIIGKSTDEHHLIPKTFKGKEKIMMHKICHRSLHSFITEKDMRDYYHTVERLLEHEKMQKFVKWVSKKPSEFCSDSKESNSRKKKRWRGKK